MNKGSVIDEEDPCKVNPDGRQSIATAYPEKSISIPEADGPRQPLLHLLIAALGTELESPTRTGALEITASSGTLPTGTASSAGSRSDLNSGDHDCEYEEDGNDDDDQDAGDHTGDRYVVDGDKAIDFVRGKVDPSSSSVPRRTRKRFDQVHRIYHCAQTDCGKSYGTLNHLNHHILLQRHGRRRDRSEFKEMRRMLKQQEKMRARGDDMRNVPMVHMNGGPLPMYSQQYAPMTTRPQQYVLHQVQQYAPGFQQQQQQPYHYPPTIQQPQQYVPSLQPYAPNVPHEQQYAPNVQQYAANVQQYAPNVQQYAANVQQYAPNVQQFAPTVQQHPHNYAPAFQQPQQLIYQAMLPPAPSQPVLSAPEHSGAAQWNPTSAPIVDSRRQNTRPSDQQTQRVLFILPPPVATLDEDGYEYSHEKLRLPAPRLLPIVRPSKQSKSMMPNMLHFPAPHKHQPPQQPSQLPVANLGAYQKPQL